jgi:tripartite-type tricarboxylate transporter receptor subunit TctC
MVLPLDRPPMRFSRRGLLRLPVGAAAFRASARVAMARTYPDRPVRIVVGFPPGGVGDILARLIGQWLSVQLSQPFVIENRPGAAGNVGAEAAARSSADGYTLLQIGLPPHSISTEVYPKLNFDILRDVTPVASIMRAPTLLVVNPLVPAVTIPEFIAYAKAHPGRVAMASNGTGSGPHIYGELFGMMTGVELTHVPYRGSGPAMQDLQGGRIDYLCDVMTTAKPPIDSGAVKGLAVLNAQRSPALPNVPTAVEQGTPDLIAYTWNAIFLPKNAPQDIVKKLHDATLEAMHTPAVRDRLSGLGAEIAADEQATPKYLGDLVKSEIAKWAVPIKASGVTVE